MKKEELREKLNALPKILEEQIFIRCGLGIGAVIIGIVLLITCGIYLSLPWLMLAAYLMVGGIAMAKHCVAGGYTCIRGVCKKVETAPFRKAPKSVMLVVDDIPMRVLLRRQNKLAVEEGDTVSVYTSDRTPVYVKDGYDCICSYYAVQVECKGKARPVE